MSIGNFNTLISINQPLNSIFMENCSELYDRQNGQNLGVLGPLSTKGLRVSKHMQTWFLPEKNTQADLLMVRTEDCMQNNTHCPFSTFALMNMQYRVLLLYWEE